MLLAGATFGKIALSNDWLLCGPESSFQELFEFATKKATTFCTKLFVLACVSKHYSQYRERMEKQPFGIFPGPNSRAQKFSLYANLRRFSRMR